MLEKIKMIFAFITTRLLKIVKLRFLENMIEVLRISLKRMLGETKKQLDIFRILIKQNLIRMNLIIALMDNLQKEIVEKIL